MHLWLFYYKSFKMAVKAYSSFRANFWLGMVGIVILYGTQLAVLWTTLSYFKDINGWNIFETGILYGFWVLTYGLMVFFFSGIRDFSYLIHSGDFDIYKVRPAPLIIQVMSGRHDFNAWVHTAIGILTIGYCLFRLDYAWTSEGLAYFALMIAGGVLIQAAMLLLWAGLSFWVIQTGAFSFLTWNINANYLTYPLSIYPDTVKGVFTVIPLAFISYYPATWLLRKDLEYDWVKLLGTNSFWIGLAFFAIVLAIWNIGANYYYRSTGN